MRRPTSPSVPHGSTHDVYLVLEDFGPRLGRAWCEADEQATDRAALVRDLLTGQYNSPFRIVAFNTAEAGRATSPWTSPTSCAAATSSTTMCPARCWTSSTRIGIEPIHVS